MAARDEIGMRRRETHVDTHRVVPAIRNRHQMQIDRGTQAGNDVGQRVAEILVLATAEAMASHYDPAAKYAVHLI